ncbi:hypothetical protein NMG60_11017206 [Bertholletia excelsa]
MYTASDQMLQCQQRVMAMEARWKPSVELAPSCPRCASSNTKFCYYNNYSLSQPRYFCKGCRRYWTKGGSLRNVPVGGGCRKGRRPRAARPSNDERVTASLVGSPPSPGPGASDPPPSSSNPAEIDLAAVFAKFVNQSSGIEDSEMVGSDLSGSNPNPDTRLEEAMAESQTPSNATQEADQSLAELSQMFVGGEPVQHDDQIQQILGHYPGSFGLHSALGDELGQDLLWSNAAASPDFAWQELAAPQEFGSLSSDDQSNVSAATFSDNWSLFDLSS